MPEVNIGYPDSPMEPEDDAYPCKGCGEVSGSWPAFCLHNAEWIAQVLEEGKAFELGMLDMSRVFCHG